MVDFMSISCDKAISVCVAPLFSKGKRMVFSFINNALKIGKKRT